MCQLCAHPQCSYGNLCILNNNLSWIEFFEKQFDRPIDLSRIQGIATFIKLVYPYRNTLRYPHFIKMPTDSKLNTGPRFYFRSHYIHCPPEELTEHVHEIMNSGLTYRAPECTDVPIFRMRNIDINPFSAVCVTARETICPIFPFQEEMETLVIFIINTDSIYSVAALQSALEFKTSVVAAYEFALSEIKGEQIVGAYVIKRIPVKQYKGQEISYRIESQFGFIPNPNLQIHMNIKQYANQNFIHLINHQNMLLAKKGLSNLDTSLDSFVLHTPPLVVMDPQEAHQRVFNEELEFLNDQYSSSMEELMNQFLLEHPMRPKDSKK